MPLQMKVLFHFTFYICPSNNMHINVIQMQMCAQILLKCINFLKNNPKQNKAALWTSWYHEFLITIKKFEINKPKNKYG